MAKEEKIKKFAYTQANMLAALQDVSNGMPVATAAKKHQVPRVTLMYKSKGRTPIERRMGPPSILTQDEENELVLWISAMFEAGFPVTKTYLLNYVQRLVRKLNRPNPFTGDRPGKSWYQNFLKRNRCLSSRLNENLILSRAEFNKESLGKWFSNMYNYLEENECAFILNEPERLFSCDETGILLNPKDIKTLKNQKHFYQGVNNGDNENITIFMTGNASGQLIPPMVIYKYEEIPIDIVNNFPENWSIGRSESGWMTSDLFYEFLANVFVPWLRENNIELPIILFTDGHALHLTIETSRFCRENQIILVALHLNTAHLLQPLDISVFKALKTNWSSKVNHWKLLNSDTPTLQRKDFAPLLKEALNDLTPEIVSHGFKITGLYPWNPDIPLRLSPSDKVVNQSSNHQVVNQSSNHQVVNQSSNHQVVNQSSNHQVVNQSSNHQVVNKSSNHQVVNQSSNHQVVNQSSNHQVVNCSLEDHINTLEVLEKYIGPVKLALFKQTKASIELEDISLFEIWKKIRSIVQSQGKETHDSQ